jgi:hypothetical protein
MTETSWECAEKFETKLTGKPNAPITANLHSYHQAGINSAKSGATAAVGAVIGAYFQ